MSTEASAAAVPRPEFLALGTFYKAELEPWLEQHEGRRLRARRLRWVIIGAGWAALAAWAYYLLAIAEDADGFFFWLIFFLAVGVAIAGNVPLMNLQADVKKFVMNALAGFFKFSYEAKPDFDGVDLFRDLDLLPYHTRASFEDGLAGEIRGVPFRMVEAKLTERRGTGKNAKTVTVFRGLLLRLPCQVTGPLAVWRREDAPHTSNDEWRECKLGDPAFDQTYIVHAANAEVAHQQLDAEARRIFSTLDSRDDVENVRFGMAANNLLLVVERGVDSFEAGKMSRPLADPDRIQSMVDLFAVPFDAVDAFRLQPAPPPA